MEGRWIYMSVEFAIVVIYGPNTNSKLFFQQLLQFTITHQCQDGIIISEEFSEMLPPMENRFMVPKASSGQTCVQSTQLYMYMLPKTVDLNDVWRHLQPLEQHFTHFPTLTSLCWTPFFFFLINFY